LTYYLPFESIVYPRDNFYITATSPPRVFSRKHIVLKPELKKITIVALFRSGMANLLDSGNGKRVWRCQSEFRLL